MSDVGEIKGLLRLGLEEWSGNVDRAIRDAERVSQAIDVELLQASKQATTQLAGLGKEAATTTAGLGRMESQLSDVRLLMSGLDETTAALAREFGNARRESEQWGQASLGMFRDMRILLNAIDENLHRVNVRMDQMGAKAQRSGNEGTHSLRTIAGVAGMVHPRLGQLVSGFTAVEGAAAAMGVSIAAALPVVASLVVAVTALNAAFDFGAASVRVAAQMEGIRTSFTRLLGSAEAAKKMLASLRDFTAGTSFDFQDMAGLARQMMTAGVAASEVGEHLRVLGEIAAGAGTDIGGLGTVLTQILNKGKADTRDLMQIANDGIPIWRELAVMFGLSTEEVRKLVENGKIGFSELMVALEQMTRAGGLFHGAIADSQQELLRLAGKLGGAWRQLQEAVGEVIIQNLDLKGILADVIVAVKTVTPMVVGGFDVATQLLSPFVDLLRQLMNLTVEIIGPFSDLAEEFGEAFGENTSSMLKTVVILMEPLTRTAWLLARAIEAVVDGLKWIKAQKDNIADVLYAAFDSDVTADQLVTQRSHEEALKIERQREVDRAAKAGRHRDAKSIVASLVDGEVGSAIGRSSKSQHDRELERAAAKEASDLEKSADRTTGASAATEIAKLRLQDKGLDADLATIAERFRGRIADAKTPDERRAFEEQMAAEQALVRKKVADAEAKEKARASDAQAKEKAKAEADAQKKAEQAAKQAEAEQKKRLEQWRTSVERSNDMLMAAQLMQLRMFGKDWEATLLEIEGRFQDRMRKATSDYERDAAQKLRSAEIAAAQKDRRDADRAVGREPMSRMQSSQARISNARTPSEKALAELDMREAVRGRLSPADEARRQRLRDRLNLDEDGKPRPEGQESPEHNARRRMTEAKSPLERALAQLDLREATGRKLSPEEEARRERLRRLTGIGSGGERTGEDYSPSRQAAAAAAAGTNALNGRSPGINPGGGGPGADGGGAGAGGRPTINLPAVDYDKLGRALFGYTQPYIDRQLAVIEQRAKAASYGQRAAGGA